MAQHGSVFREPVNRAKHLRKDALRAVCLMVGKLLNVDTLLFRVRLQML
jgi:hypothetical protein